MPLASVPQMYDGCVSNPEFALLSAPINGEVGRAIQIGRDQARAATFKSNHIKLGLGTQLSGLLKRDGPGSSAENTSSLSKDGALQSMSELGLTWAGRAALQGHNHFTVGH